MATKKCMQCGGTMKKMQKGGAKTGSNESLGIYGIPNAGRTDQLGFKKGGSVKNAKLAALAAPKNKITRADVIAGAKKKAKLTKKANGGATPYNPQPTKTLENMAMFIGGGLGTALAARKQNQPMSEKKKERVLAKQQRKTARKSK